MKYLIPILILFVVGCEHGKMPSETLTIYDDNNKLVFTKVVDYAGSEDKDEVSWYSWKDINIVGTYVLKPGWRWETKHND